MNDLQKAKLAANEATKHYQFAVDSGADDVTVAKLQERSWEAQDLWYDAVLHAE
jgi:hypothetical protein